MSVFDFIKQNFGLILKAKFSNIGKISRPFANAIVHFNTVSVHPDEHLKIFSGFLTYPCSTRIFKRFCLYRYTECHTICLSVKNQMTWVMNFARLGGQQLDRPRLSFTAMLCSCMSNAENSSKVVALFSTE